MITNDQTQDAPPSPPPMEPAATEAEAAPAAQRQGRGKSPEAKRSHEGMTVKFRVFPEEAAKLKERAAESSMTVSEFCRRASSGKRIVSRYDYDVIRRLAELHGDQARLGNLLKLALDQDERRFDKGSIQATMLKITENQELIKRVLTEVHES